MNVLVTGSAGFVGRYMCKELRDHGYSVIPFDVITGQDLLKPEDVAKPFIEFPIDVVCHLGAQAHLGFGEQNPVINASVNILGTINVLDAALKNHAHVIYHSTGAVYSDECAQPVNEESPREPKSHYGASKLCAEEYALLYLRRGLKMLRTRFSSVYGIGRDVAPVNIFTKKAIAGEHITIYGPDISRDYTHVSDVVRGVRLLVQQADPARDSMCAPVPWDGRCFNIASGIETKTIDVVRNIEKQLDRKLDVEIMPAKKGDVMRNYFDIDRIKYIGYRPTVSLADGIRELLEHYQSLKTGRGGPVTQTVTAQSGE